MYETLIYQDIKVKCFNVQKRQYRLGKVVNQFMSSKLFDMFSRASQYQGSLSYPIAMLYIRGGKLRNFGAMGKTLFVSIKLR